MTEWRKKTLLNEIKTKNAAWTNVTRADFYESLLRNSMCVCVCVCYDVVEQTSLLKSKGDDQPETCNINTWSSILGYIWSISNPSIYNYTYANSLLNMNHWSSISLSHSISSRSQKANGSPAWLMWSPQRNHKGLSHWRRMKTHLLIAQSFSLYKNLWLLRTIPQGGRCIYAPVCPFHPAQNHPTISDSSASLSIKCLSKEGQNSPHFFTTVFPSH